jgi:oligosaccharide repeat unit polymerase
MFSGALTNRDESLFCSYEVKSEAYLFLWLTSSAFVFGMFALWSEQLYLLPYFFVSGYAAVLIAFVRTIRVWNDFFNPLCLLLAIGIVRFSCAAFLLLIGAEPPEKAQLMYQFMALTESDWHWAHALALVSLLGVVLGWSLVSRQWVKAPRLNFYFPIGIKYAALTGMAVGLMALLIFVGGNASLDVITSGEFRGTTVQIGTGKYMHLSIMLISASVLFSGYLVANNSRWTSLIPVILATVSFWVLGGRGRAMTSLACGLLLLWYVSREQKGWARQAFKRIYALIPIGLLFTAWALYFGSLYRGGWGLRGLPESLSLSGIWHYIQSSIFLDVGHLHGLAGAVAIGPGVLEGRAFMAGLFWPLTNFFPVPGRSAGVFIIETLVGFADERRWGVHASLIGDTYLDFGLAMIAVVMLLFGMVLKVLYVKFRRGVLNSAVYSLAVVHGVQMFFGSIDVLWQTLIALACALLIVLLGGTIFKVRRVAAV